MTHVNLYSDGAARGNPGPGGLWGRAHVHGCTRAASHQRAFARLYLHNQQSYGVIGVIRGLEALKHACEVDVYSDSKYVVDAFNQHWVEGWLKRGWKNAKKEPVKNKDL